MKQELRDRWCAALEDGSYLQGRDHMVEVKGGKAYYCCLAVLRNLVNPYDKRMDDSEEILSTEQLAEYGLPYELQPQLVILNDGRMETAHQTAAEPKSFPEIAAWIRINVPVTP